MKGLITCLWFDGRAEEVAEFYVSMHILERYPAPKVPAWEYQTVCQSNTCGLC